MDHRAGHIENNVISTAGQPYQRIVLRARHNESFRASDLVIKTFHARRSVIWNNIAPQLGPKADDEVHSSSGGAWFTDSGDFRSELLVFLRVQQVKLQVRVRRRAKREDAGLRRVHAGIIAGAILANPRRTTSGVTGPVLLRHYTGDLDGVARPLPGKRHVLAGIFLQIVKVLVINLENLALTHQHVFAAAFDARERAVFVRRQVRMGCPHLCVACAARAVRDLSGPRRPEAGRCQQGRCETNLGTHVETPGKLDRRTGKVCPLNGDNPWGLIVNQLDLGAESARRRGVTPGVRITTQEGRLAIPPSDAILSNSFILMARYTAGLA